MVEKVDDLMTCPTFSGYSADGLAAVAARVLDEEQGVEEGEGFEFSLVFTDVGDFPADDLVPNDGPIRPTFFPIFNRELVTSDDCDGGIKPNADVKEFRMTLKKLILDDRKEVHSSSSSEADELETLPEGTYCVWRPKVVESSPSRCKKGNSTGSGSKRWNIRSFLWRNNSEGKEPFVFLTPRRRDQTTAKTEFLKLTGKLSRVKAEVSKERRNSDSGEVAKVIGKSTARGQQSSPHEVFYIRSRAEKEGGKRMSYLPYRRDLLRFFGNGAGMLPFK